MSKLSSASKIKMTAYDELFGTEESTIIDDSERIQQIPLTDLFPFKNHPFKVLDDDKMEETKESISKYGVLMPIIARPRADGGYELVAGHRRKRACELLELETIPTLVRNLDDDESTIIMVDSNIQRENLLYSEKAYAYKMKLDAVKHQGVKTTCCQLGDKYEKPKSVHQLSENTNDSARNIHRYIRLTELITSILNMVDDKKLAFNTAVELSYLSHNEQQQLLDKVKELDVIPSMAQASKLKKYSSEGNLSETVIDSVLSETANKPVQVILKQAKLSKYFSKEFSPQEIEKTIIELLEQWHKTK